jgi:hypothetical protein
MDMDQRLLGTGASSSVIASGHFAWSFADHEQHVSRMRAAKRGLIPMPTSPAHWMIVEQVCPRKPQATGSARLGERAQRGAGSVPVAAAD